MSHYKARSDTPVGPVDWSDPHLRSLLEKTADWRLDNRSSLPPQEVQVHISSGWATNNTVSKPALVVVKDDGTMVLVTDFAIPQGEHVGVDSARGDGRRIAWGKVIDGREGHRTEDREQHLFLSWLRLD
ncbi:hypothetical protein [Rudaea cellulosilytica]|uniref:hypothetical protein n=1 Tax=Rudaea cellulosilytica TaxID=540746 RepID=UPI0003795A2D|nr:hypothetical protein [Rudaea cellulosilytica]